MRRRDVAVVLLACFALFLALEDDAGSSVALRKAWVHPTSAAQAAAVDSELAEFEAADALPAPVVVRLPCIYMGGRRCLPLLLALVGCCCRPPPPPQPLSYTHQQQPTPHHTPIIHQRHRSTSTATATSRWP